MRDQEQDVGPIIDFITTREKHYKEEYQGIIRNEVASKFGTAGTDVYDDITKKVNAEDITLECPECAAAADEFIKTSTRLIEFTEDLIDESYTDVASSIANLNKITEEEIYEMYVALNPDNPPKHLKKDVLRKIINKIICIRVLSNQIYEGIFDEDLLKKVGLDQKNYF